MTQTKQIDTSAQRRLMMAGAQALTWFLDGLGYLIAVARQAGRRRTSQRQDLALQTVPVRGSGSTRVAE